MGSDYAEKKPNGQVTFWKGGVTSQGMNRPLRKIHRSSKYVTSPVSKRNINRLHPRLFFLGGGFLDFPRCTVFISSTSVNFHWLEARARWIGLNEFPQICFWVLTPSSTKYIAVVFFPLYIIHSIFSKKKTKPGILFWITLFRESPCRSTNFRLSFDFWRLAAPTLPRNVCLRTAAVLLMKHICLHISSHPPIRLQRLSAMPLAEKFCALKLGWKLWIAVKWHA